MSFNYQNLFVDLILLIHLIYVSYYDVNSRVGPPAMNYFLVMHDHPPVIMHEEDRRSYYAALETWDFEQELDPLCAFLREQTMKTWKKQVKRLEKNLV